MTKPSRPRYSVIIFTKDEPATIEAAVLACFDQDNFYDFEILVVAPDPQTKAIVENLQDMADGIRFIQDERKGKPAAINIAIKEAQGDILIFTDGDVEIGEDVLQYLVAPLRDKKIGAVSGHPVPMDSRDTKFGYWAHLLTEAGAHRIRTERAKNNEFIEASAYLMAVRAELLDQIPEDALADDPVISHIVADQGFRVAYAPKALVFVKYPDNYTDWKLQKRRSIGGYQQGYLKGKQMRSFTREAARITWALSYPHSPREFWWTIQLIFARIHVWLAALWHVRIRRRSLAEVWKPIKSTK